MRAIAASRAAGRELVVRPARPEDDAPRRALLAEVAMDSELSLSVRRAPTMEALYALHATAWDEWVVAGENGRVEGMGSVLVREEADVSGDLLRRDVRCSGAVRSGTVRGRGKERDRYETGDEHGSS